MTKENREERRKDSDRKYREVHKEEIDAKRKIYNVTDKKKNYFKEWYLANKEKRAEIYKNYRATHKAEHREYILKRTYGISLVDYKFLLDKQEGRCAICREKPGKRKLSVDHDHVTGNVRGLLCSKCNSFIGLANDEINKLNNAIRYLIEFQNGQRECVSRNAVKRLTKRAADNG